MRHQIKLPVRMPAKAQTTPITASEHTIWLVLFILAHGVLAWLVRLAPATATLHALATLALGLYWALFAKKPDKLVLLAAYIAGAEVLWRMTNAEIYWEYGKYATALVLLVASIRFRLFWGPRLVVGYFLLLVPAAVLTIAQIDAGTARSHLSFNLSGPLALVVCTWFFAQVKLSLAKIRTVFLTLLAPVFAIATLALISTLTASAIQFSDASNFVTSGGYGPNQVSAVLGLAALLTFFLLIMGKATVWLQTVLFVLLIIWVGESALTFSRGGLYAAFGSGVVGSYYFMCDPRSRNRLLGAGALFLVVAGFFLLPKLDALTEGHLTSRFRDLNPTGRDQLVLADVEIWRQHPVLGVGVGLATAARGLVAHKAIAHTEFSRLLSEHGLLGGIAFSLLLILTIRRVMRAPTAIAKALVVALVSWSFLFMMGAAMRLVAPAFVYGLAFLQLSRYAHEENRESSISHPPQRRRFPKIVVSS